MVAARIERRAFGALAALLLLAACSAEPGRSPGAATTSLDAIPAPDLAGLEPAVTESLAAARAGTARALAAATDERSRRDALAALARVYHAYHLVEPARAAYAEALRLDPDDEDLLYLAGRLELDAAEVESAAALLGRAVELRPRDAHALVALADAYRRLGQSRRALETAQAATSSAPAFGLAWLALAEAAADADEAERAASAYQRFFTLQPEASKYRAPYAQALRRSGRAEEALAQLALRGEGVPSVSDPRLAEVVALRASARVESVEGTRLIQAGALDAGVAKLEQALRTDPDDAQAHRNLAVALTRLGRGSEALAHIEETVRLTPADPAARFALGAVLASLGRLGEAEAAYIEALELDPGHLDALQNLASLRIRGARPAPALDDFRRLCTADPTRVAAWLGIAAAEIALGRDLDARKTLDDAMKQLPGNWQIASAWCRVASAARDPRARDGAAALARARALVSEVRHPVALASLAMALAETGDFPGAIEAQKRAIALTAADSGAEFRAGLERDLELYLRGESCRDPGLS